jgi:hypothetical protein
MVLLALKVHVKGQKYVVQEKPTATIRDALEPLCQHVFKTGYALRLIVCDRDNNQVNDGSLVKWFHGVDDLYVSLHQGRTAAPSCRRSLSTVQIPGAKHIYFYITFGRGTQKMFVSKWGRRAHYLRIDCMAGDSFNSALRRDGRIDLYSVSGFTLTYEDPLGKTTHHLPSYVTTARTCTKKYTIIVAKTPV